MTTINLKPRMTLEEFAKANEVEIEVNERDQWAHGTNMHFYAHIPRVHLCEGTRTRVSTMANGATPGIALSALARRLSGAWLEIDSFTDHPRKLVAPILTDGWFTCDTSPKTC